MPLCDRRGGGEEMIKKKERKKKDKTAERVLGTNDCQCVCVCASL